MSKLRQIIFWSVGAVVLLLICYDNPAKGGLILLSAALGILIMYLLIRHEAQDPTQ